MPASLPAGLLGHSHNDRLWALNSFGVRGTIEPLDGHWVLVPERHVGGMGKGGLVLLMARSPSVIRRGRVTPVHY